MKIISKDFCTFSVVYIAIYMGPCRRSYILLVRKFRTSEMLEKWSPTSKLSDIKLSHIPDCRYIFFTCTRTYLSAIPVKPVFWYFKIFPRVCYDWGLNIGYHVNFADLGVTSGMSTFCMIFTAYFRTIISPDFTWILIDWVSAWFSPGVFSLWPEKKRHRGKSPQKNIPLTQSKISLHVVF